jgi:hypothetical protein
MSDQLDRDFEQMLRDTAREDEERNKYSSAHGSGRWVDSGEPDRYDDAMVAPDGTIAPY